MSTYTTQNFNPANGDDIKDKLYLSERYIYGSSRLGLEQVDKLMALKQAFVDVDLSSLDFGETYVLASNAGPAGTWFVTDDNPANGTFSSQTILSTLDYNNDGKTDMKISHDASSDTYDAHLWSELNPGGTYTVEWDMLTTVSNSVSLIPYNISGAYYSATDCNAAGHYSTTFTISSGISSGRTRFKFYAVNQAMAMEYIVANFKVFGPGNPWGKTLPPTLPTLPVEQEELVVGDKRYELSNHLGNVLAVVTDRKIPLNSTTYTADVVQYTDYSPFGVELDNRHSQHEYRYSMNGMEHDDEISGDGNSLTAEFWQYSPRIARRWEIDPIVKYHESPYATFANNPICYADPTGADTITITINTTTQRMRSLPGDRGTLPPLVRKSTDIKINECSGPNVFIYNTNSITYNSDQTVASESHKSYEFDPLDNVTKQGVFKMKAPFGAFSYSLTDQQSLAMIMPPDMIDYYIQKTKGWESLAYKSIRGYQASYPLIYNLTTAVEIIYSFYGGNLISGTFSAFLADSKVLATAKSTKYWSDPKMVNGVKVYQRDGLIDPLLKDANGLTNLERMQKGLAPYGADGKPINLHHIGQMDNSSIVELTASFHKKFHKALHINPNTIPSGINRAQFTTWRVNYWKSRAFDFVPK